MPSLYAGSHQPVNITTVSTLCSSPFNTDIFHREQLGQQWSPLHREPIETASLQHLQHRPKRLSHQWNQTQVWPRNQLVNFLKTGKQEKPNNPPLHVPRHAYSAILARLSGRCPPVHEVLMWRKKIPHTKKAKTPTASWLLRKAMLFVWSRTIYIFKIRISTLSVSSCTAWKPWWHIKSISVQ